MPENTTLFSLSGPSRELPGDPQNDPKTDPGAVQQVACPKCKALVLPEQLVNKKRGKATWCIPCREAYRGKLTALGPLKKKHLPVNHAKVKDDLDALVEAARLEGQFKAKALMTKGFVSQKAWAAAFRSRKAVEELVDRMRRGVK